MKGLFMQTINDYIYIVLFQNNVPRFLQILTIAEKYTLIFEIKFENQIELKLGK